MWIMWKGEQIPKLNFQNYIKNVVYKAKNEYEKEIIYEIKNPHF